jgi:myb proto-oncogene protein
MDLTKPMDPSFFDSKTLFYPPSAQKRKGEMVLATPHRVSPWKRRSCTPLSTPGTSVHNLSQGSLTGGLNSGSFQSPPLTPFLLEQMNSAKSFDATPTTLLDLDMEVDVNCLDSFGIDTTSPGSRLDFSQQALGDMTPSAPLHSDGNLRDRTNMDPIYMSGLPKTPGSSMHLDKMHLETPGSVMLPPLSSTPGTHKRKMQSHDLKMDKSFEADELDDNKSLKKQSTAKVRPVPSAQRSQVQTESGKQTSRRRSRNFGKTWTMEEDEQLRLLVSERGARKWSNIAKCFDRKNSKQCRERWHNILDPMINWEPFEAPEDEIIIKMVKIEGFKWSKIAAHLPGRTDNHVKNRWNATLKRETQEGGMYFSETSPINLSMPPFVNPNKLNKQSPTDKALKSVKFDVEGIITSNNNDESFDSSTGVEQSFAPLQTESEAAAATTLQAAHQLIRLSPSHVTTQSRTAQFGAPPSAPVNHQSAMQIKAEQGQLEGVGNLQVVADVASQQPC